MQTSLELRSQQRTGLVQQQRAHHKDSAAAHAAHRCGGARPGRRRAAIGGDVVEVAPQYDANTTTAQVGGQMAFEILSLMAVEATAAALD